MSASNPYNNMESADDEIQPDFLKGKSGRAQEALGQIEQLASLAGGVKTGGAKAGGTKASGAKAGGGQVSGGATGSSKGGLKNSVQEGANSAEKASERESGDSLYSRNKSQSNESGDEKSGFHIPKGLIAAAPILLIVLLFVGIIALVIGAPLMIIGTINANLIKALGFDDTIGILEKQGEYVTAELAANGKFPENYAKDLALNGVDVGQVTANGDFIKTNNYIANIEEKNGLVAAASGFTYSSDDEGELAFLFKGNLIKAGDFVAKVESDPELYADYSKAADISAKFYYGEDVNKTFKEMGLSRGNFNSWEKTGDYQADEASFVDLMNQALDNDTDLSVGGKHEDKSPVGIFESLKHAIANLIMPSENSYNTDGTGGGSFYDNESNKSDADSIVGSVTNDTKEYIEDWHPADEDESTTGSNGIKTFFRRLIPDYTSNAKNRAAELLNSSVSASEPYLAANSFMVIEEPIQRAMIDGDGPVNELMNVLNKKKSVEYQNVETGGMESAELSILETENFKAAVGERTYSAEEAANFGRDRVLKVTGLFDKDIVNTTVVSADGKKTVTSAVRNGIEDPEDMSEVEKADKSIDLAMVQKNSDVFQSVIGGNRVIEGGSFLSNTINMRTIGAMPSDASKIASYDKVVEETVARRAEAERATLSPFDISSSNTFFGNIVHNLATAMLRNSGGGMLSAVNTTADVAGTAVANLMGSATAEGADQKFTTMSGLNCETAGTVNVECDLYGTTHNTVSTEYMEYTLDDWKASPAVGSSLDDEGNILDGSDENMFVMLGMNRYTSVGVKSAEVCDVSKNSKYDKNIFHQFFKKITDILGVVELYDSCKGVEDNIATGAEYTFGDLGNENVGEYSGYILYNEVKSLLSEEQSAVSKVEERYYAKHPKDNSRAGILARISGMNKWEVELALSYGDYLTMIANYDSSDRFYFGDLAFESNEPILKAHNDQLSMELLAWYKKETEYRALRNRQEIVS